MTERQYNSKLLGHKLSQLTVPPNEALWSQIEAQLLAVPPVVQHPPATPTPHPVIGKAILTKTIVAIVATILLVVFIIWLANKKTPTQQQTPVPRKTVQRPIADSIKNATPIVAPTQPAPENKPLVKPSPQPAPPDTTPILSPSLPTPKSVELPLRDSMTSITPPVDASFQADSVKLPPKKKDEGYYFEVKKKKG